MKKINELSDKEILALTSEQLDKMVKLEMAEKGIKILEKPQLKELKPVPEKTEVAYNVSGVSYPLKNKEQAEKLAKVLEEVKSSFVNTSYVGSDYATKYIKEMETSSKEYLGKITEELYYSRTQITSIKEVIDENKAIKEAYDAELSEYNSAYDEAAYIREDIYNRRQEVVDKYYRLDNLKTHYEQYLKLADGNAKTAMKFLKNAFTVDAEAEKYVVDGKVDDTAPILTVNAE